MKEAIKDESSYKNKDLLIKNENLLPFIERAGVRQ
jgi:hypothetical protein